MEADAEHQEDHAKLGQLTDRLEVPVKPRSERPERHSRDEVADDSGQPQPPRHHAADQRVGQRHGDRRQQWQVVHAPILRNHWRAGVVS